MDQTLNLYRLQLIDHQMDQVRDHLQAVQIKLEDDLALRQIGEQVQTAESRCKFAEQTLHQEEAVVKDQKVKIEQAESSLYSGNVHNPKELQDLQSDATFLKRRQSELEDQLLEAMLALEEAEKMVAKLQSEQEDARAKAAEKNLGLHQEQKMLEKELQKLSTERGALASVLTAESLQLYDRLRQQHRGVAVVTISDNACDACGSQLTPAQAQAVRSASQMAFCPSCGRILFSG